MAKYRLLYRPMVAIPLSLNDVLKLPVVIEATQWFKSGDHPKDDREMLCVDKGGVPFLSEGKIVRYYRHPDVDGQRDCQYCENIMHDHGWIDTIQGGHNVCPGDWIITGIKGEYSPFKPDIFEATYELVKEESI